MPSEEKLHRCKTVMFLSAPLNNLSDELGCAIPSSERSRICLQGCWTTRVNGSVQTALAFVRCLWYSSLTT